MKKRFAIITTNHVGQKYYFCYYSIMGISKFAFVSHFTHATLYFEDELQAAEKQLLKVRRLNNVVKYHIEEM